MEWLLSAVLLGTMLFHGGFYPGAALTGGFICAFALIFFARPRLNRCVTAMLCFDAWYIVSSIVNGYSVGSISHALLPLAVTAAVLCALTVSAKGRRRLMDVIVAISGVMAIAGISAFNGALPIGNAVTAGRLQFPFEYANTLGAWLGASVMVGWERHDKEIDWARLPALTALFLTRSVGAIAVYAVMWAVRLLSKKGDWRDCVILHTLAAIFAAVFYLVKSPIAVIFLPALVAASCKADAILRAAKKLRLQYAFVIAGCACAALFMAGGRLGSAVSTFAERLAQMRDGMSIIADHPLFGVGAGNWERVYTRYQSAQYISTVVHSGIVGIGVDGGIPAMALFCACVFLSLKTKARETGETFGAWVILAHSLIDFDLTFFPVFTLTFLLLTAGKGGEHVPMPAAYAAPSLIAVLIVFAAYANSRSDLLVSYTYSGEWHRVIASYEKNHWLVGKDAECARHYAGALYITGSPEKVPSALGDPDKLTYHDVDLAARAMKSSGQTEQAFELYLDQLEAQPYNVRLFYTARSFLTSNDAPDEYVLRYNSLARDANSHHSALGELMGNQEEIAEIDIKQEKQIN